MHLTTTAFADLQPIPEAFAFARIDGTTHVALSENLNPDFAWSALPQCTQSVALICHDPDVLSRGDDVNKEGRVVPASLARVDFFHWVLIDLPPTTNGILRGEYSRGVSARGKPGPEAAHGTRQGLNDYTGWFAADQSMAGSYFGYDGPCPPWNDELPHRYIFSLYALDLARLPVVGIFTGPEALSSMTGHVLAQASLTGRYTLNPKVRL